MELRQFIYEALNGDSQLTGLVHNQVMQRGVLTAPPKLKPFLSYTLTATTPTPEFQGPRRHSLVVYIHDTKGDYLQIDAIMSRVELVLGALLTTATADFIRAEFVERSGDLVDPALDTFYRSTRYQLITAR